MKPFPALFAAEAQKKRGAQPVWILKCPFATGTIYLSDYTFAVAGWNGGITAKPWIHSWAGIDENIAAGLAMAQISEWNIDALIDHNIPSNISSLLWNPLNSPETTDCTLYYWYIGLNAATDPPQPMSVWNIADWDDRDELVCRLRLTNIAVRLDKCVGTIINTSDYPNADPDDVGKSANTVIGGVDDVPCHAIAAGWESPLVANIDDAQLIIEVSDASLSPGVPFTVQCEQEQMRVTGRAGNVFTVTRGFNSTTKILHDKGSGVYEVKSEYVYLAAQHIIKAFRDIKVDSIRQTTGFTTYTGRAGNAHPAYPGRAVVSFAVKPVVQQQVNLILNNSLTVDQGSHNHAATGAATRVNGVSASCTLGQYSTNSGTIPSMAIDSDPNSACYIDSLYNPYGIHASGSVTGNFPAAGSSGWVVYVRYLANFGTGGHGSIVLTVSDNSGHSSTFYPGVSGPQTIVTRSFAVGFAPTRIVMSYDDDFSNTGYGDMGIYDMYYAYTGSTISNSPASGVALLGAVSLSGNSSANVVIGKMVTAGMDGAMDDAGGSITGVGDSLIERPDFVLKWLYYTYAGWPIASWYTNAATIFAGNGFKFAGVINDYPKLNDLAAKLAFQCQCYFRITSIAQLLWRNTDGTPVKTITNLMIRMQSNNRTTLKTTRSRLDEVINKITVLYNRDWTQSGSSAYRGATALAKDGTLVPPTGSIGRYGEKERPDLFMFDFVRDPLMAVAERDFYLSDLKDRAKIITWEHFLDNSELEFADWIFLQDQTSIVELREVNLTPGSGRDMRNDAFSLMARVYGTRIQAKVTAVGIIEVAMRSYYRLKITAIGTIEVTTYDKVLCKVTAKGSIQSNIPPRKGWGSAFGGKWGKT